MALAYYPDNHTVRENLNAGPFALPDDIGYGEHANTITHEASGILVEYVMRFCGFPNLYSLGRAIGMPQPERVRKDYWGGPRAIGSFNHGRLTYLMLLKAFNPQYWTVPRLLRINWDNITSQEGALGASKDLQSKLEQRRRRAKGRDVVASRGERVPVRTFQPHRHLAMG